MNNVNVDKMFTAGNGPFVEIALKRYYVKDGERLDKAPEKPYEARAEIGLQLTIPENLRNTGDPIRDAACEHSYTRKAQEHFQAVIRNDSDIQVAADGWEGTYGKLIMGERERGVGGLSRADTTESLTVRMLTDVLKDRHGKGTLATAKHLIPRLANPPKTEKGSINFNAWAKILQAEDHAWYTVAKKQAEKEMARRNAAKEKDFE